MPPILRLFFFSFFFFGKGFFKRFLCFSSDRSTDPKSGNEVDTKRKKERERERERKREREREADSCAYLLRSIGICYGSKY